MLCTEDKITIPPNLASGWGRVWELDLAAASQRRSIDPAMDGTVAMWLVEASWAHPLWHSYVITLIHLRPLPRVKEPTKFYLEGATHEMWVHALDPDSSRQEMVETGAMRPLLPTNFAAQFIAYDDAAALARVTDAIKLINLGALSPDTDYIHRWADLFGDNMLKDRAR